MPYLSTSDGVEIRYHIDVSRDPWIDDPQETVLMHHAFARNMKWWTKGVPINIQPPQDLVDWLGGT